MRVLELLMEIRRWQREGRRVALATLVDVHRSAPRDPGAVMVISESGDLLGSISGGCVESALAEEARRALSENRPRLVEYGLSDADAQAVGLSCGGTLTVLVEPLDETQTASLEQRVLKEAPIASAVRIDEAGLAQRLTLLERSSLGTLGSPQLDDAVATEIREATGGEATEIRGYGEAGEPHGDVRVFIHRILPKPRMYIFGAIDFAHAMARVAKVLGYEVTICDARPAFAKAERFPEADRVVAAWPDDFLRDAPVDPRTAIVALTHDEKFDLPLIRAALQTPAGYIGVMGSRRTNARRLEQLRDQGIGEDDLARLSAPIGLDLGARTPEETALAIAAEIVAVRHGREGGRLRDASGSIRGLQRAATSLSTGSAGTGSL